MFRDLSRPRTTGVGPTLAVWLRRVGQESAKETLGGIASGLDREGRPRAAALDARR